MLPIPYSQADHRALHEALRAVIADGATPGGVILTGAADGSRTVLAAGAVAPEHGPERPDEHTLYDLASLTKVVATWPLVGRAVEMGLLDIDTPLREALPAMSGSTPSAEPTVRQILTHTSGMRATTRLDHYRGAELPLYELMCREPLDDEPGRAHRYINRGFVLLGLALAHVHGRALDQLARELFDDLGMPATTYGPLARSSRVAPTESRFPGAPRLWGTAHDDNAALLGGVAGHAGIFASAHDLATYAERLLGAYANADDPLGAWFRAGLVPQAEIEPGLHRGLAWVTTHGGHTAYHHGFTGTSLYLAPAAGRYLVITTNAIHNGPARTRLAPLRALALKVLAAG